MRLQMDWDRRMQGRGLCCCKEMEQKLQSERAFGRKIEVVFYNDVCIRIVCALFLLHQLIVKLSYPVILSYLASVAIKIYFCEADRSHFHG